METEGIITRIVSDKYAEVCLHAKGSCENCSYKEACFGGNTKELKHTIALNEINANIGDAVIIESAPWRVVTSAFLVYIFPIILMFIGYFASKKFFQSEGVAIILSILSMAMGFLILRVLNKYFEKQDSYKSTIKKII